MKRFTFLSLAFMLAVGVSLLNPVKANNDNPNTPPPSYTLTVHTINPPSSDIIYGIQLSHLEVYELGPRPEDWILAPVIVSKSPDTNPIIIENIAGKFGDVGGECYITTLANDGYEKVRFKVNGGSFWVIEADIIVESNVSATVEFERQQNDTN